MANGPISGTMARVDQPNMFGGPSFLTFNGKIGTDQKAVGSEGFRINSFQCNLYMIYMGVSKNNGTPKSSMFIGFSIIFTIHLGGKKHIFGLTPI